MNDPLTTHTCRAVEMARRFGLRVGAHPPQDCAIIYSTVRLGWWDRVKVLFGWRVVVATCTLYETILQPYSSEMATKVVVVAPFGKKK